MVQQCLAYPIVARLVCSTCAPVRYDVPMFLVCYTRCLATAMNE